MAKAVIFLALTILLSIAISQRGPPSMGPPCDTSGLDASYEEIITADRTAYLGYKREIIASGCPNHPSVVINPTASLSA